MSDLERELMLLLLAHAPSATSAGLALDLTLNLRSDLGLDLIALAELAVAIEDAFGIEVSIIDVDGCRTIQDLQALVVARSP